MRYNAHCYIAYGGNQEFLNNAVQSLLNDGITEVMDDLTPIVIMDNTLELDEKTLPEKGRGCIVLRPFDKLLHGQSINAFARIAIAYKEPFIMSLHSDAVVKQGAIKSLLDSYEKIKETQWGTIVSGSSTIPHQSWGDAFCLWNPEFFDKENVWHDPFLFPMYYMDNHFYRIQKLRGWSYTCTGDGTLIDHFSSHMIKKNPLWGMRNDIVFKYHGMIYNEIWGGYPPNETVTDPHVNGLVP